MAEQIGASRQAVSKWEPGESRPDVDKLVVLFQVLDLPLENGALVQQDTP